MRLWMINIPALGTLLAALTFGKTAGLYLPSHQSTYVISLLAPCIICDKTPREASCTMIN